MRLQVYFCVIFLYIVYTYAGTAWAQAPKAARDAELRELRERISQLQSSISSAEAEKSDAAQALSTREKSINDINCVLHELTQEKVLVASSLTELTEQINVAKNQARVQQNQLNALLRAQQRNGSVASLRLFLEGSDVAQAERQLHYYGYIASQRAATVAKQKEVLQTLNLMEETAVQKQELLLANEVEQNRTKRQLEVARTDYKKLLLQVSTSLDLSRVEVGRLQKDEEALSKLIANLAKPPIEKAIPPKTGKPDRPPPPALSKAPTINPPTAGSFPTSKGALPAPLVGELIGRFGAPREAGGLAWKGVFIRAKEGEKVLAVAAGRVAHSGWLRGFGNLIIIDHGDTYMSLYANNEALLKNVGETVAGGDAIAIVGNGPIMLKESGVYFEIRYEGSPLDPAKWLKR